MGPHIKSSSLSLVFDLLFYPNAVRTRFFFALVGGGV